VGKKGQGLEFQKLEKRSTRVSHYADLIRSMNKKKVAIGLRRTEVKKKRVITRKQETSPLSGNLNTTHKNAFRVQGRIIRKPKEKKIFEKIEERGERPQTASTIGPSVSINYKKTKKKRKKHKTKKMHSSQRLPET